MQQRTDNTTEPAINLLLVEDPPDAAELWLRPLREAGCRFRFDVVQTEEALRARLADQSYDVVLADQTLLSRRGLDVAGLLRQMEQDIPLILITGTLSDEATAALSKGVVDYVHKDRLNRLPVAVLHASELQRLRQERRRMEQELARSDIHYERVEEAIRSLAAFAELNPNPVIELSDKGQLTYANAATNEMVRRLGRPTIESFLPPGLSSIVSRCLGSQTKLCLETAMSGKTFFWSFFPLAQSQVVHCYVNEITERLNLECQLRHSQKMESVGRLAAGVAHDLNNILTVIQGQTGLIRDADNLSEEVAESVRQVSRAAERASKLTAQLLAFSRRSIIQPRSLDLNEVLTSISHLLGRTLGEDLNFQFGLQPDLPPVYADADLMEHAITNVAVNARDAMPDGGQLLITTSVVTMDAAYVQEHPEARTGRFICLTMTDTGCGMDHATMSRIFEPFFTTKQLGKGTGLGLPTVYGIVKQHHGWVEVQSRVGQGTTFKVFLPPADESAAAGELPIDLSLHSGTETILVVEDEATVRFTARTILDRCGYRVLEAANGVEALAIWHRQHENIALLLTDMVMPVGLSGQELAEKFCAQKPNLKVIYTSGYSIEAAGKGLALMEGLHFLQKPFDSLKLAIAVRECLDSGPVS